MTPLARIELSADLAPQLAAPRHVLTAVLFYERVRGHHILAVRVLGRKILKVYQVAVVVQLVLKRSQVLVVQLNWLDLVKTFLQTALPELDIVVAVYVD